MWMGETHKDENILYHGTDKPRRISYFSTTVAGAGIFLPVGRATRRGSPSSHEDSIPLTPTTPSISHNFKVVSQGSSTYTPPTPAVPKFSQSVGPARAQSPYFKKTRPSLPRPESPVRRPQLTRPSIGTPSGKTPARYGSPAPGKFGQSVRGTQDSRDPAKRGGLGPKPGMRGNVGPRSVSALGQIPMGYSDDDATPVGASRIMTNGSMGSVSSFQLKMRPASRSASRSASRATSRANEEEVDRLRTQLDDRDKMLKEQASNLAEMESSINELQTFIGDADGGGRRNNRAPPEDRDAATLRSMLREKNEKIAMLTAEFDAHRADFRSTIDTLEMASTETERVYEKRVEELLAEVRELQERSEDVDSVARQLKQLEELVQELEEGLEDARRGEAEARGEVEFLRGEVERTRSELRREREKAAASLNGDATNSNPESSSKELEQRDDEIRGLKAIIHSLSRDAVPDMDGQISDSQKTPTPRQGSFSRRKPSNDESVENRIAREKLEGEVAELRALVESKTSREDELERELEKVRRMSANAPSQRASGITVGSSSTLTQTQEQPSRRDSKGTVASWRDRERTSTDSHRRTDTLETMPESDTYSSANESFCELCETSGHDILTCTNMFAPTGAAPNGGHSREASGPQLRIGKDVVKAGLSPKPSQDEYHPAPLSPIKRPLPTTPPSTIKIIPNPMESGPVAGKESGVVNMDKWCGVCEREGLDSIDCPFEDAF